MIEYAKQILPKVSRWKDLFRKELIKSIEWGGPGNRDEIYNWCCRYYAELHSDILEEVFPVKMKKSLQVRKIKDIKSNTAVAVYKKTDFVNSREKRPEKL